VSPSTTRVSLRLARVPPEQMLMAMAEVAALNT
jgi:hypothetical protein